MALKESLFKVQSLISKVHKDGKNTHTKAGYPTLEAVLDVLNEPLQETGLIVTQITQFKSEQWVLTTTICTKDGKDCESFDAPLLGLSDSKNPMQALGSALTYQRRYSLMNYFKLAATDDDGESLGEPSMKFSKPKPFIIADGTLKGKDASKMKPEELNQYLKNINDAISQTGGTKPKWFSDLEKFVAEREKA